MKDIVRDELGAPKIVDRSTFQAELDASSPRNTALSEIGGVKLGRLPHGAQEITASWW
jgi:hypothetical protein